MSKNINFIYAENLIFCRSSRTYKICSKIRYNSKSVAEQVSSSENVFLWLNIVKHTNAKINTNQPKSNQTKQNKTKQKTKNKQKNKTKQNKTKQKTLNKQTQKKKNQNTQKKTKTKIKTKTKNKIIHLHQHYWGKVTKLKKLENLSCWWTIKMLCTIFERYKSFYFRNVKQKRCKKCRKCKQHVPDA